MRSAPVATVDQLRAAVVGFGPGDELPVKVDRNGTMVDLVLRRIEAPAHGRKPSATATPRLYGHRADSRLHRMHIVQTGAMTLARQDGGSR